MNFKDIGVLKEIVEEKEMEKWFSLRNLFMKKDHVKLYRGI